MSKIVIDFEVGGMSSCCAQNARINGDRAERNDHEYRCEIGYTPEKASIGQKLAEDRTEEIRQEISQSEQ